MLHLIFNRNPASMAFKCHYF